MTTVRAIRRRMYALDPSLGRVVPITSLTAQTIVCNQLATGSVDPSKYIDKWLVRSEAASTADRVRIANDFVAATGAFQHEGAAYSDTTATSEFLEISEHDPYLLDDAIFQAVRNLRRIDREIIPMHRVRRYWIDDLSWIEGPDDILSVARRSSPVLSRNRNLDRWNTVSDGTVGTAGDLQPDWWTLAGSGATFARTTSNVYGNQPYALAVTRAGTDATVTQTVGLLSIGVAAEDLQGKTVTVVLVGRSGTASSLRARVTDGVDTTNTSYHSGGDTYEELSATHTVNAAATTLTISARLEQDETAEIAQLYVLYGTLTDSVRRDDATEMEVEWSYDQSGSQRIFVNTIGWGSQLVVTTQRPYPSLDVTSVRNGAADGHTTDAPENVIATGALGRLYRSLAEGSAEPAYGTKAQKFSYDHDRAAAAMLAIPAPRRGGGFEIFHGSPAGPWRRGRLR